MAKPKVLVLARESLIAALLGMLLELENLEPVFPQPGERAEDALARLRPPLVVVLDGDLEVARSDLFFARAARAQASVVLFSVPGSPFDAETHARERGIRWFGIPSDRATLARALEQAIGVQS